MRIAIVPNAFKNCLPACEVAKCIFKGLQKSKLSCDLTLFPIGDGGDDTMQLLQGKDSTLVSSHVHDPLGRIISAGFGWNPKEKEAIIGISEASGLKLVKEKELTPLHSNTFGSGEIMKIALDMGAEKLILCAGGSATVDGGTGLLRALGARFLDKAGNELNDLPLNLLELKSIDLTGLDQRLLSRSIIVLCDVNNTLLGKNGAVDMFGPQKGAGKAEIALLNKILRRWSKVTYQTIGANMELLPFGGAAGGLAAGLAAYVKAHLVSGIEFFLDNIEFDSQLRQIGLVITAEGSLDNQTLEGKGPYGVARRAKEKGIPVIGLAGQVPLQIERNFHNYFDVILPIGNKPSSIQSAIDQVRENLIRTSFELGNLLRLGLKLENESTDSMMIL